ncbi:hypothetical protein SAMN05216553_103399 [Lentzea fradiae]|uniref:Uncharacterized protein n=1 Tax=Lentzea fradiae TaxID=200378 RepID=A0A1G7P6G5_9PSEU|nr:hypothetical protein [Lentzea fradiae]SDF81209.1 hypothetical protein SAMN05216553_103399 [Lentzea fradiae]
MKRPRDSGSHQHNNASHGGNVFANQGSGQMNVHQDNSTVNHFRLNQRKWTGWAILVMLVADVVFFIYGATSYSGNQGDSGDGLRAVVYLLMLGVTITLVRRWFRQRL